MSEFKFSLESIPEAERYAAYQRAFEGLRRSTAEGRRKSEAKRKVKSKLEDKE